MEWQPIRTAPKNEYGQFSGPMILIYSTSDDLPWPAYWGLGGTGNEAGWVSPEDGRLFDPNYVTHWMPLPAPPVDTAGA